MFNYAVGADDKPLRLLTVPQPRADIDPPVLLTDGGTMLLSYGIEDGEDAIIELRHVRECRTGHFNPQTFASHPLHARGLTADGIFEIDSSGWKRAHEAANETDALAAYLRINPMRHLAITTSTSVFECLAETISLVAIVQDEATNSLEMLKQMARRLGWGWDWDR